MLDELPLAAVRTATPLALRIGIDVGGTKTHVAAVGDDGARLDHVVPSSSWRTGALFSDSGNLARLADLIRSLVRLDERTTLAAGMHGCDTPAQVALAARTLERLLAVPVRVVNDAELLGHAARVGECLQMIVGTGAVVVGRTATGATITADGYGWLLSDFGSAPALLRESVREALVRADRDELGDDSLVAALQSAYGVPDLTELALAVTERAGLTEWGGHAPLVFAHADRGSAVALHVITEAARRLAANVASLLARGALGDCVVAAGGVITNQPRLQHELRLALAEVAPGVRLEVLDAPPVDGALVLAGAAPDERHHPAP
ncbi:ATPase [Rathayibacter caricis DSM 15933]|uniref:ATPase n=1 Tax=Rathayibacter caricis DSM 15933 TaxID=1328867 RepID=A0A2T4URQ3_9MICO|nr:ATPase [Rathayibacter caricis]PTL72181.1 ATPase [Rathayibacter caricis DSM 15933]